MTKTNLHNQTFKSHKIKCVHKIYKSNPYNSAKTGQGLGCPELSTSQLQLISTFSDLFFLSIQISNVALPKPAYFKILTKLNTLALSLLNNQKTFK